MSNPSNTTNRPSAVTAGAAATPVPAVREEPATVDLSGGFDGPSAKARGSSVLPCGPICPQCGCEFTAAIGLAKHLVRVHGFLGDEADQAVRLAGPRQARAEQFGERATARPL